MNDSIEQRFVDYLIDRVKGDLEIKHFSYIPLYSRHNYTEQLSTEVIRTIAARLIEEYNKSGIYKATFSGGMRDEGTALLVERNSRVDKLKFNIE